MAAEYALSGVASPIPLRLFTDHANLLAEPLRSAAANPNDPDLGQGAGERRLRGPCIGRIPAAVEHGQLDLAETAWRRGGADGNPQAMSNLGLLLNERGETTEAEQWYRKGGAQR